MDLDTWLTFYRNRPGYRVTVEEDGGEPAWMVYDETGELIDWWWFYEADRIRPMDEIPRRTKPG